MSGKKLCVCIIGLWVGLASAYSVNERIYLYDGLFVVSKFYANSYIIHSEVHGYDEYLNDLYLKVFHNKWRSIQLEEGEAIHRGEEGEAGLIPTIHIPIRLPGPMSNILGEGGSIKISGSQRIELGGQQRFVANRVYKEGESRLRLPELMMKQQLRVKLQGTIGERLHAFIDHDSERELDIKNTIRLKYEGGEDDIIQGIEAGNVGLTLPGVSLIGARVSHRGLFGLKSYGMLGPVNFTIIASKQQGETQTKHFEGRAARDSAIIRDIDFVRGRFFWVLVDTVRDAYGRLTIVPDTAGEIIDLKVYYDDNVLTNNYPAKVGVLYDMDTSGNEVREVGFFDAVGYEFYTFDEVFKFIELNKSLDEGQKLGVIYKYVTPAGDTIQVGDDSGDTLRLVALKLGTPNPAYMSWWREWKNVYSLPAKNIDVSRLEISIYRRSTGEGEDQNVDTATGKPYVELLGLQKPNGELDLSRIHVTKGIIIFPEPFPFLKLAPPDSIYHVARYPVDFVGNYYIKVIYMGVKAYYNLGFNVIEGSEVVKLDGRVLQKGKDYSIDYETGMLTLHPEGGMPPDAHISIDYEVAPFLSLATRNLLGMHADYEFGWGTSYFTLIYNSVQTPAAARGKPKIGEEPRRGVFGEMSIHMNKKIWGISKLIDRLPIVTTEVPTEVEVSFHGAVSAPNPNTYGRVYLDDFENTLAKTRLGTDRLEWSYGSVPKGKDTADFVQVLWYNPVGEQMVEKGEVYPNLPEYYKKERISYLRLVIPASEEGDWISLQKLISRVGEDFTDKDYIEIRVRGKGVLYVDLGTDIPEDAPRRVADGSIRGYNGELDAEGDPITREWSQDVDDVGLDGVEGNDEYDVPGDDGNDDYRYDPGRPYDYSHINGTEGDGRLNTEDLNGNGVLDMEENYYEYRVDLEDTVFLVDEYNGWRLYQVPLKQVHKVVGAPSWDRIRMARIWVEVDEPDTIDIVEFNVVGTKWRVVKPVEGEPKVEISYISTIGAEEYTSPPGVRVERDELGRLKPEGSMVLRYWEVAPDSNVRVYFTEPNGMDFLMYKSLVFYVRLYEGDPVTLYVRFGGDTVNFYEYKVELNGYGWREVKVPFKELTNLKMIRPDTVEGIFRQGVYGIRGRPSLTNIRRVELVIANEGEQRVSGVIWVDDLFLGDVRAEVGVAGEFRGKVKLADVADVDVTVTHRDPYFKKMGEAYRFGGGEKYTYKVNGSVSLHKFLPKDWGVAIPVQVMMSRSRSLPRYLAGKDVELKEDVRREYASWAENRSVTMSWRKNKVSRFWLTHMIFDNLSVTGSYRQGWNESYESVDSSYNMTLNATYEVRPSVKPISIWKWEWQMVPQNVKVSANYGAQYGVRYRRVGETYTLSNRTPWRKNLTYSVDVGYSPMKMVSMRYGLNVVRDMVMEVQTNWRENVSISFTPGIWKLQPRWTYSVGYNEYHGRELISDTMDLRNVGLDIRNEFNVTVPTNELPLLGWVNPVQVSVSKSRTFKFYYLKERPPSAFRYGRRVDFENLPKLPYTDDMKRDEFSMRVGSGFNLRDILSADINYRRSRTGGGKLGNFSVEEVVGFPDARVRITRIERYVPGMDKIVTGVSPALSYRKVRTVRCERGDTIQSVEEEWNLQVSGVNLKRPNMPISFSISEARSKEEDWNHNVWGERRQNMSFSTSFRVRTEGGRSVLKWLKGGRSVNFILRVNRTINERKNITTGHKTRDSYSLSVGLEGEYMFSSVIEGGASISYSRSKERTRGTDTQILRVRVWTEFKF